MTDILTQLADHARYRTEEAKKKIPPAEKCGKRQSA